MIKVDIEQGTPEWFALKAGVPSASNFDKIVTTKGIRSKSAEKYLYQLAGERITGIREEGYQNAAMLRGIEMEQEAVNLYELARGVETEKVGIIYLNEQKTVLCSPDRLIQGKSMGLLEVKCPLIQTHVGYLVNGKLDTEYFQQVQGQMYVTGAEWCDLFSYFPGIKPLIIRIVRDETFISALDKELKIFCKQLEDVVAKIK